MGAAAGSAAPLRVLALAAPGDLMANTPIEFLLENEDVVLDVLYVAAGISRCQKSFRGTMWLSSRRPKASRIERRSIS